MGTGRLDDARSPVGCGICLGAFAVVGSLLTLLACGARDGLTMGFVDDAAVAHEPTPQPDAGVDAASDTDEPAIDAWADGRAIAIGSYQGTTDLSFGASSASLTANGGFDAFLAAFGP